MNFNLVMKSHTPFDWWPGGYRGFNMRDADTLTSVFGASFPFFFFFSRIFPFFPPLWTEAFLGLSGSLVFSSNQKSKNSLLRL